MDTWLSILGGGVLFLILFAYLWQFGDCFFDLDQSSNSIRDYTLIDIQDLINKYKAG